MRIYRACGVIRGTWPSRLTKTKSYRRRPRSSELGRTRRARGLGNDRFGVSSQSLIDVTSTTRIYTPRGQRPRRIFLFLTFLIFVAFNDCCCDPPQADAPPPAARFQIFHRFSDLGDIIPAIILGVYVPPPHDGGGGARKWSHPIWGGGERPSSGGSCSPQIMRGAT